VNFVHSKVIAWVAFDRAVCIAQEFGADGPLNRLVRLRSDIHYKVCHLQVSAETTLHKNDLLESFQAVRDID